MELKEKALTIALIAIIVCAGVGGYLLGKQRQYKEDNIFFTKYINDVCECFTPLTYENGFINYNTGVVIQNDNIIETPDLSALYNLTNT